MELNLQNSDFLKLLSSGLVIILTLIIFLYLRAITRFKRERKKYFRELLVSKNLCMVINKESKIQFINQAFKKYFEKKFSINLGQTEILDEVSKLLSEDSREIFNKICAGDIRNWRGLFELSFFSEGVKDIYWNVSVEVYNEFRILYIDDITTQKVEQFEKVVQQKYIDDLLDQSPIGFFSVDLDGKFCYINSILRKWLGIKNKNIIDVPTYFRDFVSPDLISEQNIETDEDGKHGSLILRPIDGEDFLVYLVQSEKLSSDGDFKYSRSIVFREPFATLSGDHASLALLEQIPWLFSDSPVGIVMLNIQGEVIECNRAFLKLLGLHRDGVLTRPLSERINKEDRSDADAQFSKVVMGIVPATLIEVRMPAGGERELTASLFVSRICDTENDVVGLVVHVIDTTEQKNLEVQFNQAQKMQAVGQLAGGVAHDFNNLLTAMGGFCDLLLDRHGSEDPSFSDIMQIKQNTNRAANLVRQLLAFSRRQTLQPKVFAIRDALSDLSNLLRRLIGENIELEINHGVDVDLIRTDPGQFDQVIINLAVNSRDAMPGGGIITVLTERVNVETSIQRGHEVMSAGEYILIKVVDTGSGIAREDIGRIFEPFFSTKGVGEGTGLGLSTVYGIIRQSDGYIFVDSALGEGTSFSIYLPAFSAAEAEQFNQNLVTNQSVSPDLTGAGTILLVEDEDAVRLFGSRALRNKGYRVLEARDGESALDVINAYDDKIDLILTDVMMPGMDGHTLVRLILEELPDIRVILMSGYAEDAIPGEISENPTINFLSKPFSLQDLALKVKEVLTDKKSEL